MNINTSALENQIAANYMRPEHVYFNGKFLTGNSTGVHRVAEELLTAVDQLLTTNPALAAALDFRLIFPHNTRRRPPLSQIHQNSAGFFTRTPWEQIDLPFLTADGLCINLSNAGPLLQRNAITMMHDAQVYSSPASYSFAFRLWYKVIQPLMGRYHRHILTVSEFSKSQLVRYGIARTDKISVIHNGCDHVLRIVPDAEAAKRHGLDGKPYVLALSNTQHHKNISVLLKAFSAPEMSGISLVLFGRATSADFEAKGSNVPDNVRFMGNVSDQELAALMISATAFACPSLTEGFGLPPLEAMLLGCPAIIAPCGALPEVCGNGALAADPHDARDWSRQILRLVEDTHLREEMRVRGQRQARQFTWDRAARQLLKCIAEASNTSLTESTSLPVKITRLSLVMTTLNRLDEVRTFLEGLTPGIDQDIEVIIVDQNDVIDLKPIIEGRTWPFKIIHKCVPGIRGSSRGRNIGIGLATGDIICFPDDDCLYPPRLLRDVIRAFDQRGADIVCGRPADEHGQSINGRFATRPLWVRKEQVFITQTEWLLFFRRETLAIIGLFDEHIGLGADTPWQSAEGQDLTLYGLERGCRVWYDPSLIGHHPKYDIVKPNSDMLRLAHKYGRGMGYVIGKHRLSRLMLIKILLRPLFGAITFMCQLNFPRARYYMLSGLGRLEGYLAGQRHLSNTRDQLCE